MKRSTPMKRTAFVQISRSDTLSVKVPVKEAKPPKGPKPRKCGNKACRAPFVPFRSLESWCSPSCGAVIALEKAAKQKAKADRIERADIKRRKAEAMPLRERLKKTETVMNRYVRVRDAHLGCCSCDKPASWDGQWHASHFKSVGSNSILRFNLWNINKACAECNLFMSGNIAEYEKRLRLKKGSDCVEWLHCQNGVRKYDAVYLDRMSAIFTKKTKRAIARREGKA